MADVVTIRITFNGKKIEQIIQSPNGDVGRYLRKRGLLILSEAKAQVGVKTGRLKASLHMQHGRSGPGQFVKIGSPLNYALAHHEGTRPHVITPNRKEYLRFSSKGRVVYSRVVMHPGTKPNKYLTDNLYLIRS